MNQNEMHILKLSQQLKAFLNKQTGGNTSKADVDNALNAVTRAKAALNGADNLRNAKTTATNTINGLPHLTQLQKTT